MPTKTNIHARSSISKTMYRSSPIMISGRFTCDKNKNQLLFQSYLELGVLRYFALNPDVQFIDSQQGTMKWLPKDAKHFRTYTPDIVTVNVDGEITFTEVKPVIRLTKAEKARLGEIRDAFSRVGFAFQIKTDEDMPYEAFVNTGQLLAADISHYKPSFIDEVVNSLYAMLPERFTFKQFEHSLALYGFPICHFGLIKAGHFAFNLRERLQPSTLVWRTV